VHYDREISMKMKIEVSSQDGSVTISSVTEPIIAQKVAEQVIQVKDGEPSLLAGILTKQDTINVSGTPGLGELPILKYFFSSQSKEVQTDEIVFLVIPHIVRESVLTDQNTRAIYTGTSNSIDLIRKTPEQMKADAPVAETDMPGMTRQTTSAANAASAMIPKLAADARPLPPPGANPAANAASAALNSPAMGVAGSPIQMSVVPAANNQGVGATFQVAVMLSNANDLFSVPLQLQFNSQVLSLVNVDAGDLLGKDGQAVALVHRDDGNGAVTISAARPPGVKGVDGSGTVCTLTFKAIAPGDSSLQLVRIGAKDSKQNSLPAVGTPGMVHIK
jgi:general secretion pathway protein D